MKAKMKTPYLDNEIGEIELWVTLNPNVSKSSEAKLAEYQQIKDTLLEYELNKEGLARVCAENQRLKSNLEVIKAELEKMQKHFTAKDLELQTVKAELEMSKYTGQSAVNELHKYKQETDEVVRTLNAERDELRAFVSRVANAKAIRSEDTDFLQKQAQQLLKP